MTQIPSTTLETVLLVEDNEGDVGLIRQAFAEHAIDAELAVVRDGVEALEYLARMDRDADFGRGDPPALVLLDLNLPRMNGFEVLERIRADEGTRHVPVVILSSSSRAEDMSRGYALGASSYIHKPQDLETFLRTVGQIANYWLRINHGPPPAPFWSAPPAEVRGDRPFPPVTQWLHESPFDAQGTSG